MPYFLSSISRVSDGQGLRQWWTNAYFFMKAVTGNPKLHLDWKTLENTGNWYLYVHQFIKFVVFGWFCSKKISNSSFFGVVDMNSITDAAIINRFLKLLFCNRSWFLDITQSKYIITRQQCLKSPEMLILCEAGQNDLQKCPSLTKFLPTCYRHSSHFHKCNPVYIDCLPVMMVNCLVSFSKRVGQTVGNHRLRTGALTMRA